MLSLLLIQQIQNISKVLEVYRRTPNSIGLRIQVLGEKQIYIVKLGIISITPSLLLTNAL